MPIPLNAARTRATLAALQLPDASLRRAPHAPTRAPTYGFSYRGYGLLVCLSLRPEWRARDKDGAVRRSMGHVLLYVSLPAPSYRNSYKYASNQTRR